MYDFTSLSPTEFQDLSCDLLSKQEGVNFHTYSQGRDKGIDFRHTTRKLTDWIGQCKHWRRSDFSTLYSKLKSSELPKVQKLKPERYFLTTSVSLTPQNIDSLFELFSPHCQSKNDIYGCEQLNDLLRLFPEVNKQHYKLWLTSAELIAHLVSNESFNYKMLTEAQIKRHLELCVYTEDFRKALQKLEASRVCILTGTPGVGKTTLAHMLAARYMQEGWELVVGSQNVSELLKSLDRSPDKRQILLYDDFLGTTTLGDKLAAKEDAPLISLMRHVSADSSKRFILTTREYILATARQTHERLASEDLSIYKFVLQCSGYSPLEKAKILANHLFFNGVPSTHIDAVIDSKTYWNVINHRNYTPRIIQIVTLPERIAKVTAADYSDHILKLLDNPVDIWQHPFENQLSEAAKHVVLCLATCGTMCDIQELRSVFEATYLAAATKYNFSTKPGDFEKALDELEGNFTNVHGVGNLRSVAFHNPSVLDFVGGFLRSQTAYSIGICENVQFFEQVNRLALSLSTGAWGSVANYHNLNAAIPLAEAFIRAFHKIPMKNIRFIQNAGQVIGVQEGTPKIDYIERLHFGAQLAGGPQKSKMLPALLAFSGEVIPGKLREGYTSAEACLDLLSIMTPARWFGHQDATSFDAIVIDFALDNTGSVGECVELQSWLLSHGDALTEKSKDELLERVYDLACECVSDQASEATTPADVEGLMGEMEEIWDGAGISEDGRYSLRSSLYERIDEIKDRDRQRHDAEDGYWGHSGGGGGATGIDGIFDSLRD
ncbi:nSTAND3 domain-containing NTPase [Anatilimnocola floriformis]|uniref:nSTAND3 domain-containing NTPase n=1 Tax=Anatilimnocola floriformis TaxID=2948575 RepID=UPI0020C320EB|nr:restriction endonuclease [Anatilimnocola floriformis]